MRRSTLSTLVTLSLAASPFTAIAEPTAWLAPPSRGESLSLPATDAGVPDPGKFLGYPLGSGFTPHTRILDYLDALAAVSYTHLTLPTNREV